MTRSISTRTPVLLCVMREVDKVAERSVAPGHNVIIGNVVSVISIWTRLKGNEPDAGDPEDCKVLDATGEALEIADAVAVRVHERFDVEAVDDGVLVPEIVDQLFAD